VAQITRVELPTGMGPRISHHHDPASAPFREFRTCRPVDVATPPYAINAYLTTRRIQHQGMAWRLPARLRAGANLRWSRASAYDGVSLAKGAEDIAVVAFDDPFWADLVQPPLSALAQPVRAMTSTAVRLLIDNIEGRRRKPERIVFRFTLKVRESSGRSVAGDPHKDESLMT
jgi:Periplasmic binding protein-like domain